MYRLLVVDTLADASRQIIAEFLGIPGLRVISLTTCACSNQYGNHHYLTILAEVDNEPTTERKINT